MEQSTRRHLAEMVIAMLVGMVVLEPVRMAVMDAPSSVELSLAMATEMSVGMTAWMCLRGHPIVHTLQMCAAMYASFALLFPLLWLGLISGASLLVVGHVVMLAAMAVLASRHARMPTTPQRWSAGSGELRAIDPGESIGNLVAEDQR